MNVNRRRAAYAILTFCALGACVSIGFAQSTGQPNPKLSLAPELSHNSEIRMMVEIFDYAQVPHGTLQQSEQVTSSIFARAGVNLVWMDCTPGAEPQPDPECSGLIGPTRLGVRILPRVRVVKGMTGDATAGYTVGYLTAVSLDWAQTASANDLGSVPDFLGCAIAHELGHVLLGTHSHSLVGLMGARWGTQVLQTAGQHSLLFAPEQAAAIRAEVMARARPSAAPTMARTKPSSTQQVSENIRPRGMLPKLLDSR